MQQVGKSLTLVLVSVFGFACSSPPPDSSLPLDKPLTAMAAVAPLSGKVLFSAQGGTVMNPEPLDLAVNNVDILVHTENNKLFLDDLQIAVGDLNVAPAALPPSGLSLKNVTINLTKGVNTATSMMTADAIAADMPIVVALKADLILSDNKTYPLGPVEVAPMQTTLSLTRSGADYTLGLTAHCDGGCWDVPGVAHFSDGDISLALPLSVTSSF